ncbi:hypothetical protein WN943_029334 [Citrus x changshan-huyou]
MTIRNSHYPESPHPKLTIGVTIRSDPGFVTMLIQDRIVASKSFVKINADYQCRVQECLSQSVVKKARLNDFNWKFFI